MRDYKAGDVSVYMSRWTNNEEGRESGISLTIEENISRASLRVELSLEAFALAVTGAEGRGKMEYHRAMEHLGKKALYRHIRVEVPYEERGSDKSKEEFHKRSIKEHCPEGYTYSHGGYGQQGLRLSYVKWVDPDSEES